MARDPKEINNSNAVKIVVADVIELNWTGLELISNNLAYSLYGAPVDADEKDIILFDCYNLMDVETDTMIDVVDVDRFFFYVLKGSEKNRFLKKCHKIHDI